MVRYVLRPAPQAVFIVDIQDMWGVVQTAGLAV